MNTEKENERNNQVHSINILLVNVIRNNMNKHAIATKNWAENRKWDELVTKGQADKRENKKYDATESICNGANITYLWTATIR